MINSKITILYIIALAIILPCVLQAQDNIFEGTTDADWDTPSNWSTGKVPPTYIVQKITIAADCNVSNATNYTFAEGSTFRINTGVTFTSGTGTWTMEGTYDRVGTYVGNLVIDGTIEPGDNVSSWVCGDPLIYDGQSYATKMMPDGKCWMAENLNIGTMINGSGNQTDNATIEKYCYGDNTANCTTYGGLYQWDEMMQYVTTESTQGVCPTGWHLPSDAEWTSLKNDLPAGERGSRLAGDNSLWNDGALVQSANFGTSGFAALPGGFRYTNGSFTSHGNNVILWSSTEIGSYAWLRSLYYDNTGVNRDNYDKAFGFSVRCVRD